MSDASHPNDSSIAYKTLADRDLYEPSPSAGFQTVYAVLEVAL